MVPLFSLLSEEKIFMVEVILLCVYMCVYLIILLWGGWWCAGQSQTQVSLRRLPFRHLPHSTTSGTRGPGPALHERRQCRGGRGGQCTVAYSGRTEIGDVSTGHQ